MGEVDPRERDVSHPRAGAFQHRSKIGHHLRDLRRDVGPDDHVGLRIGRHLPGHEEKAIRPDRMAERPHRPRRPVDHEIFRCHPYPLRAHSRNRLGLRCGAAPPGVSPSTAEHIACRSNATGRQRASRFRMSEIWGGMAGAAGFEPAHGGTKNRCLTAWLRPNRPHRLAGSAGGGNRTLRVDVHTPARCSDRRQLGAARQVRATPRAGYRCRADGEVQNRAALCLVQPRDARRGGDFGV